MSTQTVRFGDVVRNLNETVNPSVEHSFERVIGLEHLDPGESVVRRWDELASLHDGTSFRKEFRKGQVLFGKRRAYQRKVARADFDGICSGDILVFEPSDGRVMPEFLLYVVQSDAFFAHALQTSSGSLSPRTRWEDLSNYEFELPSLAEQARIIELISAIDAHIDALQHQLSVTQQAREAFLHARLTAGKENWAESTLGDVAELVIGKTPARDQSRFWSNSDGIPFCTIADMTGDTINPQREFVTREAIESGAAKVVAAGVLLMSFKLTIGKLATSSIDVCPNEAIVAVHPRQDVVSRDFLRIVLGYSNLMSGTARAVKGFTLNKNSLSKISLRIPSLELQQSTVADVLQLEGLIHETTVAQERARSLRKTLLNLELS